MHTAPPNRVTTTTNDDNMMRKESCHPRNIIQKIPSRSLMITIIQTATRTNDHRHPSHNQPPKKRIYYYYHHHHHSSIGIIIMMNFSSITTLVMWSYVSIWITFPCNYGTIKSIEYHPMILQQQEESYHETIAAASAAANDTRIQQCCTIPNLYMFHGLLAVFMIIRIIYCCWLVDRKSEWNQSNQHNIIMTGSKQTNNKHNGQQVNATTATPSSSYLHISNWYGESKT
jgi:hypothetical protein